MKKSICFMLVGLVLLCSACGGRSNTPQQVTETEAETEMYATEPVTEEITEAGTEAMQEQPPGEYSEDDTGLYEESGGIYELGIGNGASGSADAMCKLKVPLNYYISAGYTDADGSEGMIHEINDTVLSTALESCNPDELDKIPDSVGVSGGPAGCIVLVNVEPRADSSVDIWKEYMTDYMELSKDYRACLYHLEGYPNNVMLVYEINDEWSVEISYESGAVSGMSDADLSEKLYNLIVPLD